MWSKFMESILGVVWRGSIFRHRYIRPICLQSRPQSMRCSSVNRRWRKRAFNLEAPEFNCHHRRLTLAFLLSSLNRRFSSTKIIGSQITHKSAYLLKMNSLSLTVFRIKIELSICLVKEPSSSPKHCRRWIQTEQGTKRTKGTTRKRAEAAMMSWRTNELAGLFGVGGHMYSSSVLNMVDLKTLYMTYSHIHIVNH